MPQDVSRHTDEAVAGSSAVGQALRDGVGHNRWLSSITSARQGCSVVSPIPMKL